MNTLIERIAEYQRHRNEHWAHSTTTWLLDDCTTEIQRLEAELLESNYQLNQCYAQWADVCKALGSNLHLNSEELIPMLTELVKAKEYVPMSDDEMDDAVKIAENQAFRMSSYVPETGFECYRAIESEIVARAGLIVKGEE